MKTATELENYILDQIKDLPGDQARGILEELSGDLKVMSEGYGLED